MTNIRDESLAGLNQLDAFSLRELAGGVMSQPPAAPLEVERIPEFPQSDMGGGIRDFCLQGRCHGTVPFSNRSMMRSVMTSYAFRIENRRSWL